MEFLFWLIYRSLDYSFRIFFRHIYVSGIEHIPRDKPVMLASNHSNSFLDGVVIHKTLNRVVQIFVRGDVFNHPLANKVLRQLRLFPIFRQRDARNNAQLARKKNQESMDEAFGFLQKKYALLIFSEAAASMAKTLLPIKKGTAAISLEMEKRSGKTFDLHIVPTGVNYTFFKGLRKDVIVQFGKPIRAQDWVDQWDREPNETVSEMSAELEKRMRSQIICLDEHDYLSESEVLLEMARNECPHHPLRQRRRSPDRFQLEKAAAEFANHIFKKENRSSTESKAVLRYIDLLRDHKQEEIAFAPPHYLWLKVLLFPLLLIPAVLGLLSNGLCWLLSWRLTEKFTKDPIFYDATHIGFQVILAIVMSIGFLLLGSLLLSVKMAFLLWITLLLSGVIAVLWFDLALELRARFRSWLLKFKDPESWKSIQNARRYVLALMDQYPR